MTTAGKMRRSTRTDIAGYLAVVVLATFVAFQFHQEQKGAVASALTLFRTEKSAETARAAAALDQTFRQIYRGVRTIARLPGVRAVGQRIHELPETALASAQEVYNNLAESVSVSELYIIPLDFDPERAAMEQSTGSKQIVTFDNFIIGRNADQGEGNTIRTRPASETKEIELYEYLAMKQQLDYFKEKYPIRQNPNRLDYPAIVSSELITCDNTKYSPLKPNDQDRKGLVMSVPYYGFDGMLKGIVSGVVLSSVIANTMPGKMTVLRSPKLGLAIGSKAGEDWKQYVASSGQGASGRGLLYEEVKAVHIAGVSGPWEMWSGATQDEFTRLPLFSAIHQRSLVQYFSLLLSASLILLALHRQSANRSTAVAANELLEQRIVERTASMEAAKREAEFANSAKSTFLARVSHEIRTPIQTVMTAAELLETSRLGDTALQQVHAIRQSSQFLLGLVNQLLDLSAIEQSRLVLHNEYFSPRVIAADVVELLRLSAEKKNIRLAMELDDDLPNWMIGDVGWIRQILLNLIGNSIKYTPAGDVILRLRAAHRPAEEAAGVLIEVIDTGPGIAEEFRDRLFEPFSRIVDTSASSVEGTGLGLAISKQLATAMGGTLECESKAGRGSKFACTIPSAPEGSLQSAFPVPPVIGATTAAGSGLRASVLLAEDNPQIQALCTEGLRRLGCTVDAVSNGNEAFSQYRAGGYDVVLMDCRMPEVDGLEATRRIRALENAEGRRAIPIVALTANAFEKDRAACIEAGMTEFLSKPFSREQLAAVLQRCLEPAAIV